MITVLLWAVIVVICLLLVSTFLHARAMLMYRLIPAPPAESRGILWSLARIFGGLYVVRPACERTPAALGLSYECHSISCGAETIAAWHIPAHGARGVVIVWNWYGGSKADLLEQAAWFHAQRFSAFLVDFPGHGESTGASTTLGAYEAETVAPVASYVRDLAASPRIVLYGVSLGAVAILGALRQDFLAVSGVILEASFDSLLHTVRHRVRAMGLPAVLIPELLLFWGSLLTMRNLFRLCPAEDARAVLVPALLIQGEDDPYIAPEEAVAIHEALPAERHLLLLHGLEHESSFHDFPELWNDYVCAYLHHLPPVAQHRSETKEIPKP